MIYIFTWAYKANLKPRGHNPVRYQPIPSDNQTRQGKIKENHDLFMDETSVNVTWVWAKPEKYRCFQSYITCIGLDPYPHANSSAWLLLGFPSQRISRFWVDLTSVWWRAHLS